MKKKLIPKHLKAGKILINEPVSESTYRIQPQLNINEQELLNFIQNNPDVEDLMMREYSVKNSTSPTSNQGVIVEAKKDNIKNNFFRGYNNFRYSHPWAKGLNWTPIVGDVMDGISLLGDVNNGNYLSAGLGLGMLTLPNFILKPLLKYGKLLNIPDEVWDDLYNKAIKNNNLEEVLQLRDLHFKAKAPDTKIVDVNGNPLSVYHGSPNIFNIFEEKYQKNGQLSYGFYFTPNKTLAERYTNNNEGELYKTYLDFKTLDLAPKTRYDDWVFNDGFYNKHQYEPMEAALEIVVRRPTQIKLTSAITYDDYGNIIPLSKRDDFTNPDTRYFKDEFGKEITPTPYPGPDSNLIKVVDDTLIKILKDYFSPQKINQLKTTMGWGDIEIAEFQNELLRSLGHNSKVQIKGPEDGFTIIGQHQGSIIGSGNNSEARHTITLNRARIPNLQTAEEGAIHELGGHGKILSMDAEDFGKGGISDNIKEMFPRLAEIALKNKELADEILLLNKRGEFFNQFKTSGDLELYFDKNNIPWTKFEKFNNQRKYYLYITTADEKAARAYTGLLYEKLHGPGNKTLNIELLERYFTPESVEKFKNAVLGTIPFGLMSYKLANEQEKYKQGGTIKFNPFNKFKI